MYSPCGIKLGLFAIGGNNDTFHCQFSGDGCRYLFDPLTRNRADQRTLTPQRLHFWLHKVLGVTTLSRIDLAVDDFDGLFTCDYAEKAYKDGAFRRSNRGLNPTYEPKRVYQDTQFGLKLINEGVIVGSRRSTVYWRVYNKALEQGIDGKLWYRNEVELKKVSVDVLARPAEHFAGICPFSASIEPTVPCASISLTVKKTGLTLAGRTRWLRRQCSRTLTELVDKFDGDVAAVVGLLLRDPHLDALNNSFGESKLHLPYTHYQLLNAGKVTPSPAPF
ncbi:hypothetical protein CS022_04585 [Veronia nyctiphanis]|uniref:Replication initiation protein-like C-terminal domain-containing protein n=1 Tax=Veronia nyctiphanis TaxID=1278244 RepID=A0A4Q0YSX5_9GAMM|nr:replication initiation factor domain-containing protein [Veronia nyctiphanis]RXJ74332.1 hypothetical protein CS022_04585 [Veronia nyctiphanis]